MLVYTIDKSCDWNCQQLRAHLEDRVHWAHRYTAIRVRFVLYGDRHEPSHGYEECRHFNPRHLPWASFNAWMQVLTNDCTTRLRHVLWDMRLSRAQNSFQCREFVEFLTYWSLERGIDFDFTDYMITLRWLRWLRRNKLPFPHLRASRPAVLWFSLHSQNIEAEVWWRRYMSSITHTLNCWFNQVKRPGILILHHQPTENLNNLEEVILVFKCFLDIFRYGDNDNQLLQPRPGTKDNVILRLDLTPWRRARLWHLFAKCFTILWEQLGILIMPQCPKLVLPPGREEHISAEMRNNISYFHYERLSHLTCIDIMANCWYSNPNDADLRSFKFQLHNQHVELKPQTTHPFICNTDLLLFDEQEPLE